MANEELFSIIQKVKNGEKAEDIIDFSKESIDGYTPEKTLEFVKEATTCKFCGKLLNNNEYFVCSNCLQNKEKMLEFLNKQPDNGWGYIFTLLILASFSNNENDNEEN